jgi:predicted O-methyltransferase YrrM
MRESYGGIKHLFSGLLNKWTRFSCRDGGGCLRRIESSKLKENLHSGDLATEWSKDSTALLGLAIPEMSGGVNEGDRRALYYLVRAFKPEALLEIGTHIGSSTTAIAMAATRNHRDGVSTRITTADIRDVNDPVKRPWETFKSPAAPAELMARLGCQELVTFETGDSFSVLGGTSKNYDLIFLDGSHEEEVVYKEIPLALKRLKPNGVIVLHDYYPDLKPLWAGQPVISGPYKAVQRLIRQGAQFKAFPLGALPWPTKCGSNVTSLALLGRG